MDAETFQQSGVCSAKTLLWIHNVPQEKKIHNVGVEDGLDDLFPSRVGS